MERGAPMVCWGRLLQKPMTNLDRQFKEKIMRGGSILRVRAIQTGLLLAGAVLLLGPGTSLAAAPTLGADCGAGASIAGADEAGKITLGGKGTTRTPTFSATWTNAPAGTPMSAD